MLRGGRDQVQGDATIGGVQGHAHQKPRGGLAKCGSHAAGTAELDMFETAEVAARDGNKAGSRRVERKPTRNKICSGWESTPAPAPAGENPRPRPFGFGRVTGPPRVIEGSCCASRQRTPEAAAALRVTLTTAQARLAAACAVCEWCAINLATPLADDGKGWRAGR